MDAIVVSREMSVSRSNKLKLAFLKNRDKLVGFIRKRINDFEIAEDIAQDVFYKLSNMIDAVESVDAWIYTVARNQIKDYYKKKKEDSIDDYLDENDTLQLSGLIADVSNIPDSLYTREAVWEALESALNDLPEKQKEVFVLHEFEDYSIKEIAALQNTGINTVLSRKRYAITFLRDQLNEFYEELNI